MKQTILRLEKQVSRLDKKAPVETQPFIETPAEGRYQSQDKGGEKMLVAYDLFSLFTADIIKKDIIFYR